MIIRTENVFIVSIIIVLLRFLHSNSVKRSLQLKLDIIKNSTKMKYYF